MAKSENTSPTPNYPARHPTEPSNTLRLSVHVAERRQNKVLSRCRGQPKQLYMAASRHDAGAETYAAALAR